MRCLPCQPRIALAAVAAMVIFSPFLASSSVFAQERGSLGKRVRSPEVSDDHRITFRLQAPNASPFS